MENGACQHVVDLNALVIEPPRGSGSIVLLSQSISIATRESDMGKNDVTRQQFLDSSLQDFRYEKSPCASKYRLFHCAPGGSLRFALYFANNYKKIDDGPYTLSVFLNCVSVLTQDITIGASMEGRTVSHYVLEDTQPEMKDLAEKVCQILDRHQSSLAVIPD